MNASHSVSSIRMISDDSLFTIRFVRVSKSTGTDT